MPGRSLVAAIYSEDKKATEIFMVTNRISSKLSYKSTFAVQPTPNKFIKEHNNNITLPRLHFNTWQFF